MSDPFDSVLKAVERRDEREREENERISRFKDEFQQREQAILASWLTRILAELGIRADEEISGPTTMVNGWRFSVEKLGDIMRHRGGDGGKYDIRNYQPIANIDCWLIIENLHLDEDYRQRRPDMNAPYAQYKQSILIFENALQNPPIDWEKVKVRVGEAIAFLQNEEAEAPQRKAEADAKHAAFEAAEAEKRAQEQARIEEYRREQEARQQQLAQDLKIRQEREAALRKEVADRFGVSADAFDYLIEILADEVYRRRFGDSY